MKVKSIVNSLELGLVPDEEYQVIAEYKRGKIPWYQLESDSFLGASISYTRLFDAPASCFEEIKGGE